MCQIQVAVACFAVSRTKCNKQLPMLILARAAPASAFLVMWLVAKSDKFCHAHQIAVFTERDKQNPIFGCGGHARSVVNVIREIHGLEDVVLVEENIVEKEIILGCKTECRHNLKENDAFIAAIGDNKNRKKIYEKLKEKHKGCCISIISIHANIGMDAEVGYGTFIAQDVHIGPQVQIGDNTIINTGSVIEHEVIIGSHSHIAPHATVCGRSKIGNNVFCGAGSTVIDKINICDDVVIGAGAVVIHDISESGIYAGVPARKIR